jgi:small conductance mechanosensitive channel
MNNFLDDLWVVMHNYYLDFVRILPKLGLGLIVLILTFFVASQIRKLLLTRLLRHTSDSLLTGFLAQLTYWILIIIGLSMALGTIGFDGAVTKILAGAGLSAFILGFALKDIGENFLAGILLAFKRPFKIGDLVETQGVHGRIIGLNLRETIIKTLDGKDVYVPNAGILKTPLYNYSVDNFLRLDFMVNLDNREDYQSALHLIQKTLSHTHGVLKEKGHEPMVNIDETKGSTLHVKVCFWIKSPDAETVAPTIKTKVIQDVLAALKEKGFSYTPQES